jgi:Glycosyltransferase
MLETTAITCKAEKNKKRVVVLSNDHSWTYNLRKELLAELIKNGFEVILILPYGDKIELLKEMGCKFIDLPMFQKRGKNPTQECKLITAYYRLLKGIKPDIVLTYTIKPNLYGGMVCSKLHFPYIANITGLGTAVDNKGILQSCVILLYKLGLKNAYCVFAQNKGNRTFLLENKIVSPQRVKVIPGSGVNLDRFTVSDYPDDRICKFVFISRLLREKGIEDYIHAAKIVKKKYPDTEFHVCGFCEADYQKRLAELHMEKYAVYHGMIDNVPAFLKGIHCLVHPSYYLEGTSNVCLEACASGRPVITTDHEGCRETVVDGKTGYIVPVRNSQALAKCMIQFIEKSYEEKRKMGLAARSYVEKNYDRTMIVRAYMEEIEKALSV